jgi:hypothetical protein
MPGVQDHEVVQTVSSYRTDQAFGIRILPRTPGRCEYFSNVQRRDPQTNLVAVDAIPISYQISWRIPIGEGLNDLLGCPGRGGMLSDIEVQYFATTVASNNIPHTD